MLPRGQRLAERPRHHVQTGLRSLRAVREGDGATGGVYYTKLATHHGSFGVTTEKNMEFAKFAGLLACQTWDHLGYAYTNMFG